MILVTSAAGFIGSWNEKPTIKVVRTLCRILDEESPKADSTSCADQITFVKDRPGPDQVANVASGGYRDWINTHYGATST